MSESPNRSWAVVIYNPRTLRTTIMSVTLGIDIALCGIPNFSGGTEADLSSYITECNYVMENIHENLVTVVFYNIVSKLKGDSYQATR